MQSEQMIELSQWQLLCWLARDLRAIDADFICLWIDGDGWRLVVEMHVLLRDVTAMRDRTYLLHEAQSFLDIGVISRL